MMVVDQCLNVRTGKIERRMIEVPGVMTEEEGLTAQLKLEAKQAELDRINHLREKLLNAVLLGEAVASQDRAEYRALREKHAGRPSQGRAS